MAIDPDVQVELDATNAIVATNATDIADLNYRVSTIEDGPPADVVSSCDCYDYKFTTTGSGGSYRFSAEDVNAAIDWLYQNRRGGRIVIDGENQDLLQDEPIIVRPGVEITGVGVPNVAENVRTVLVPTFSHAAQFVQTPLTPAGDFRSWGASSINNLTVKNARGLPGVRALDLEGGNHSRVFDFCAQGINYEYGVVMQNLRGKADGQYSVYERIQIYGAKFPLHFEHHVPDASFDSCMFYGPGVGHGTITPMAGSVGVHVIGDSVRFTECEVQGVDVTWSINGVHIVIISGASEPYSGWIDGSAGPIFKLGPKCRDLYVAGHSLANLDKTPVVLEVDPAVSFVAFRDLPGLRPNQIPELYHKWFTFIQP